MILYDSFLEHRGLENEGSETRLDPSCGLGWWAFWKKSGCFGWFGHVFTCFFMKKRVLGGLPAGFDLLVLGLSV